MKVGLITYNTRHLKTAQVAFRLAERANLQLSMFALPFVPRKARDVLFQHRPDQRLGPPTSELAEYLDIPFMPVAAEAIPVNLDIYLITGASLLPKEFVDKTLGRVVNAHPGIIPLSRGLDSFKWSVVDNLPLGNSLHFIDNEADAGDVFAIARTPLFSTDDLEAVARRHYDLEIDLLCEFEHFLGQERPILEAGRPARMRMPRPVEETLEQAFAKYRGEHATM